MSDVPDTKEENDPFLGAEMGDRAQRKANKKKEKAEAKPKDEIDEAISQSSYAQRQKEKRKKQIKWGLIGLPVVLIGWWFVGLFKPYEAGVTYGICRVFLENQVRYPSEMRLSTVENFEDSVRIWFTQVDAFGEYRLEPIQCFFEADPNYGARVAKVTINRREVDAEKIAAFNRALPVILKNLPDLAYPNPLPDNLSDLQIDTDMFRKKIF